MQISYKNSIKLVGITLAVCLGMKYILPVVIPFLIAWGLVWTLLPMISWIEKKFHIRKSWGGGVLLFLLAIGAGMTLYILGNQFVSQVYHLFTNLDHYMNEAERMVKQGCTAVEEYTGIRAATLQTIVYDNIEMVKKQAQVQALPDVLKNSIGCLKAVLNWLGVFFMIAVSYMMILKDFDEMRETLKQHGISERIQNIISSMQKLGGAWLRAQIQILFLVISICSVGLWLLKCPYALLLGILIGLLDALPFIGTGTILVPWAVYCIFVGKIWYAISLLLIFFAANTLRDYLEPKLIGEQMGVYPILMVAAVYIGIHVYGISGVLLGPISLILILEIGKEVCK